MKQNVKRLPYGINDFEAVIEQNQYYVDKTMYLPLLENQPSNIIFIRPRRFGKSIFLSMLMLIMIVARKRNSKLFLVIYGLASILLLYRESIRFFTLISRM